MFYSDLPSEEAEYWVKQMVAHPYSAQSTPVSNEAFRELPTSYIICENDKGILPEVQQMMIDRLKVAGVDIQVQRCSGSHSPFLSMPNVTADIIENISNVWHYAPSILLPSKEWRKFEIWVQQRPMPITVALWYTHYGSPFIPLLISHSSAVSCSPMYLLTNIDL